MSVKGQNTGHSGYEAALHRAAFYIYPSAGYLRVQGQDRIDFLQRQTTNDIMSLRPGIVLTTVLTSPMARVLDLLDLFVDVDDSLGVITLPGYAQKTLDYLKKRIFFQDNISITDYSHEYLQLDIEGSSVREALSRIDIEFPSVRNKLIEVKFEGQRLLLLSRLGFGNLACRLFVHKAHANTLISMLEQAGVEKINDEQHEILRVEYGIPAGDREITEEYTPLELNMEALVSKQKGCYTGQEVIARQITYDKITKHLAGVYLEESVLPHAQVRVDGKPVGSITSVVQSPRFGVLALAILKRPHNSPGTEVDVIDEGKQTSGRIALLPFGKARER